MHHGYLVKRSVGKRNWLGKQSPNWRKRYIILSKTELAWHEQAEVSEDGDVTITSRRLGVLPLSAGTILTDDADATSGKENTFSVRSKPYVLVLQASSAEERAEWADKIRKIVEPGWFTSTPRSARKLTLSAKVADEPAPVVEEDPADDEADLEETTEEEKAKAAKAEQEKMEAEKVEAEKVEEEKATAAKAEQEKVEAEKVEAEKAAAAAAAAAAAKAEEEAKAEAKVKAAEEALPPPAELPAPTAVDEVADKLLTTGGEKVTLTVHEAPQGFNEHLQKLSSKRTKGEALSRRPSELAGPPPTDPATLKSQKALFVQHAKQQVAGTV